MNSLTCHTGRDVIKWFQLNLCKTKEIAFLMPHPGKLSLLPRFDNVLIVREAKLPGILFTENLSFDKHVNCVLAVCNQRFYLLKMLRHGGLLVGKLNVVFCSLVVL
jgi:hypothetical protein